MKKVQKIIGISFFSLLAFVFLMATIGDLTGIGNVIEAFKRFKDFWSIPLAWFLDVALCIIVLVKATMIIIGIAQNKETDAKTLVKKNCALISLYFLFSVLESLFTFINGIQLIGRFDSAFAGDIVLIIFLAAGAVVAALASKQENDLTLKILGGVAYAILLISIIISLANGITGGFAIAIKIFLIFVTILGVVHVMTYDIDMDKLFKKEVPAAVEEKKEEKSDAE